MPIGEAIAKQKTRILTNLKSLGKFLTKAIPREHPAIDLWTAIAITMLIVVVRFYCNPHASPSKKLWIDKAIMRRKGVTLQPFDLFLPSTEVLMF